VIPPWLHIRVPTYEQVHLRLSEIFPEGTDRRSWLTNPNAARTVFVFLYCLCIEGNNRWLAPKVVTEMSVRQSKSIGINARLKYFDRILRPGERAQGGSWLARDSREGIRDEAIRALMEVGAVSQRAIPKQSAKGRYAMAADFAALFDPTLSAEEAKSAVAQWRHVHLSRAALARLAILGSAAHETVTLPDGTTQGLVSGPSQQIIKAVIEVFAPRFLVEPAVLSYSDGSTTTTYVNDRLMARLRLGHKAGDPLPDVLLVDLATPLHFVFVEAVATEGPITPGRLKQITKWLEASGYSGSDAYFVTAYRDRGAQAFRRTVGETAWKSAIWFAAEPDHLIALLDDPSVMSLRDLPGW
jgi:hypothetical protein